MTNWIWQHVIGPAINGTFAFIPLWVWIILGALALGWAWRTFGWQGLVSVGIALLTLGAYREGWKQRDSLDSEHVDGPDAIPSFGTPKKKKVVKRATDDENRPGTWNAREGRWNE